MHRVRRIASVGQSLWLDYIRRDLLDTGALARMVEDDGVAGLTSNPTIFQKAIVGSSLYDREIRALAGRGVSDPVAVYEALAVDDVRRAADVLRAVYDRTAGADGFVSLEVAPSLAHDGRGTLVEARRLHALVERPNVMIKVPGTVEGLAALEELVAESINVNVTLLFSLERYERVVDAYLRGLERKAARNEQLSNVASVASFFVSRVDTAVDRELEARLAAADDQKERPSIERLLGSAAVANAKLAYEKATELFGGARFVRLKEKGARVQRLLWASTSAKDPRFRDVKYVEELLGPETVNTATPETIEAFRDHGEVERRLDRDVGRAREVMAELERLGVDLRRVAADLEVQGLKAFADSFAGLLQGIGDKVAAFGQASR